MRTDKGGRKYFSYGEVLRVSVITLTRKRSYVIFGNSVTKVTHGITHVSVNLITRVVTSVITYVITSVITHVTRDVIKFTSDLRVSVMRN